MEITFTLKEIKEVAKSVSGYANERKVWAIHGEMGAGKTTFIHALCENLAVTSSVGSPTYSIINEYKSGDGNLIYHMDWYRLRDEEEALQAGVEEYLSGNYLCLIEWPERAPALLPEDCFHINITAADDNMRRIISI